LLSVSPEIEVSRSIGQKNAASRLTQLMRRLNWKSILLDLAPAIVDYPRRSRWEQKSLKGPEVRRGLPLRGYGRDIQAADAAGAFDTELISYWITSPFGSTSCSAPVIATIERG
jgi:hypothetical protein